MARKKKRRANRSRSVKREHQPSLVERVKAGWGSQRAFILFVLGFGVLMGLFYAVTTLIPFYKEHLFPAYLDFNAKLSGSILNALGQEITVASEVISSSRFSISIRRGCDAIEPSALFAAVVLAFPAPWRRKVCGLVVGVFFLLALNLLRIITLFFIGIHYPKMFHVAHVELWPAVFIFLAIFCWALWIQWTMKGRAGEWESGRVGEWERG